jgi:hypothetical protein
MLFSDKQAKFILSCAVFRGGVQTQQWLAAR